MKTNYLKMSCFLKYILVVNFILIVTSAYSTNISNDTINRSKSLSNSEETQINVTAITLERYELTLQIGESKKLATQLAVNGTLTSEPMKDIIWLSEDEDIISVSEDGTMTALSSGTTKITASCDGFSAVCIVFVYDLKVYIDRFDYLLDTKGKTAQIKVSYGAKTLEVPSTVTYQNEEYQITKIGQSGKIVGEQFTGSLKIPESVTVIAASAFSGLSGMTGNLTIPESVTVVGNNEFYGCSGL